MQVRIVMNVVVFVCLMWYVCKLFDVYVCVCVCVCVVDDVVSW